MQRKKSKQLISMAVYQLMYTVPYDQITVKMICEKAGVSRMSFYRYYSTKEDIFVSYADERFEDFYETYMTPDISTDTFVRSVFSYFHQYQRQIKTLEKTGLMPILIKQFEVYAAYIRRNAYKLSPFQYIDNAIAVPYFAGAFYNVLVYWCKSDFKYSEDEMVQMFEEILTVHMPMN